MGFRTADPGRGTRHPAGRLLRIPCAAAIALVPVLTLVLAARLASGLGPGSVAPAVFGLLIGALAADGLTGLVHWACDTWGDERTSWLGPTLIHSFREHHRDPDVMLAHDWVEVNREPGVASALALLALSLPAAGAWLDARPLAHGFLCAFIAYGAAANQLHFWAHHPAPPRWVRALQRHQLVLSPRAHADHHRAPNTRAYCISTGWLNAPLDALGFWRALERLVERATGARARGGDSTGLDPG